MVVNSSFLNLTNNNQMLKERFKMSKKKLYAFKHRFWQCMDNIRDKKL